MLYVELLNPSGDIVKTCKYPVDSLGVSHGDIKLDSLLTSGYYEVRAYTRYMTNWGTNAVFSRVFPIFKAPKKEGDYSDLTIRTMHFDNMGYFENETLWFKAYVTRTDNGHLSDLSKVLYKGATCLLPFRRTPWAEGSLNWCPIQANSLSR